MMIIRPQQPSDRRVQTVCLLILTLIAVAAAMWQLQPVLVPFALAIFFSQCLQPFIDLLMRRFHWPQMVAVTIAALGGAAVVTGIGFLLASSMSGMNDYADRFEALGKTMMESRPARVLGVQPGRVIDSIRTLLPSDLPGSIAVQARSIVSNTVTVLILMAFLLFGRRSQKRAVGILGEIEERVQRYISLTFVISVMTGVFVGATLRVLNVQFAAGFGFLAFLLNFIPNVGAVIATVLPIPFVFLDPHLSVVAKIAAVAIPGVMQACVGSFLQPRWMGNSLKLHPVALLLSLIFFTLIWGIAGAFLATPLTAVIKIIFEKIPETRPLAAALAGDLRPLAETIDPSPVDPNISVAWEPENELSATDDYH
jgi:AI-2 transport protein TqsA